MNEQAQQLVQQVETRVRERLAGTAAGHGMDHVLRVLANARQIAAEVGGNQLVIELAALLHDVGDAKFHAGVERSAEFSRDILSEFDVEAALVEQVCHIVDNISFRKREQAEPMALEGQIVQDADRLDALGAVGIVRTIEYGAYRGQPFYVPGAPEQSVSGLGHFYEKLFKLKALMNTAAGRRLATQREAFMHQFVAQFLQEQTGS